MRGVLQRSLRHSLAGARRTYHATVLPSLISTAAPEFKAKADAMDALIADFEAKVAATRLGGGGKAAERMRSKGKKLPRERRVRIPRSVCVQSFIWFLCSCYTGLLSSWTRTRRSLSSPSWRRTMSTQIMYLAPVLYPVLGASLVGNVSL